MNRAHRHAFTLVELLTVIAVISLLVAIVIPAISAARLAARDTAAATLIKTLDSAGEMFHGDFGRYPISGGFNPFEPGPDGMGKPILSGAQWLAMQLVGPTQTGFVNPTAENDVAPQGNEDGAIDDKDWREWYAVGSTVGEKVRRFGPYVQPDAKTVLTAEQLGEKTGLDAPSLLLSGNTNFRNGRMPMFVDQHGSPVLYYAATPGLKPALPISTGNGQSNKFKIGAYDLSHNVGLTGSDGSHGQLGHVGQQRGWDFAGVSDLPAGGPAHPLGFLGRLTPATFPTKWPQSDESGEPHNVDGVIVGASFAANILNRQVFESSKQGDDGRLVPYNPEKFILISAGRDGLYGTNDDVRNYQRN